MNNLKLEYYIIMGKVIYTIRLKFKNSIIREWFLSKFVKCRRKVNALSMLIRS
jgi:hypothetical protein